MRFINVLLTYLLTYLLTRIRMHDFQNVVGDTSIYDKIFLQMRSAFSKCTCISQTVEK